MGRRLMLHDHLADPARRGETYAALSEQAAERGLP